MTGTKDRSGGARPGSGPKPKVKTPQVPAIAGQTPLDFLLAVQNSPTATTAARVRAAIAAAQYIHTKKHDGGKKEEAAAKAKNLAGGRFAAASPPKLVAIGQHHAKETNT